MNNPAPLTSRDTLYIAGMWSEDSDRAWIEVENPVTEDVIGRVPSATNADVDSAVTAAVDLHRRGGWRDIGISERAKALSALADGIERRASDFEALYTLDQGGLAAFANFTAAAAAAIFRDTASLAQQIDLGPTRRDTTTGSVYVSREPVGPVAAIVPWNAPLVLAAVKIAPALLAGCPVIVKISPETPLVSFVLAEVFAEAGLPEGLISFLPGGRDLGRYLISRPGIGHISFTGSTAAGQQVMATAAERMTRVTLELGGKSAALVLDDAEPEQFAPLLAAGCTVQSGQVCTTQSRLLVPARNGKQWLDALTQAFDNLPVGDPADPSTAVGPLVSRAQLDRVESFVETARQEGATVLTGGGKPAGAPFEHGYWYLPTLLTGTNSTMQVNREEVFGPVITVETYEDLDAGIEAVNDTEFGLSNGIYTSDIDRALSIAPRLESGAVAINSAGPNVTAPFGGLKMSGLGREGGIEGVEAFLETKQVNLPASS
ncbi:aldehyde dehydrogenase family protein [Rhodococcus oxybenzonivorans]|uniref:aldehyde dehydrogenase family protein n=1 Tax=Rhodococcus oxybenzonivorans TaxID=1990687 RepID=UPI002952B2F6|nr:aldehyde dehydrogenase family protein [Rhodococcus oxybenzonivorans]MDV7356641.1 aldehyde dehydrogenase family protein [Rhodococcus oxybenzonivorans]